MSRPGATYRGARRNHWRAMRVLAWGGYAQPQQMAKTKKGKG